MDDFPRVSVLVVNFNGRQHLMRCLPALFRQDYPDYEILVIDNASSDDSVAYVEEAFPQARIIRSEANLGYAGANNVGFKHATGDYIAVLNPDTEVRPTWLKALVKALASDERAGLATPKIVMLDRPEKLNTCGNEVTFTGLTFCRGLEQAATQYPEGEVVAAVSGAAFVIKRAVLEEIGGFDERFFLYCEDTDLSLRAGLAGYTCLYVPTAVVAHDYTFRFGAEKGFFQERNRYLMLLKNLRWRTLAALMPSLLLAEVLAWGYSIPKGPAHVVSKLKSYAWLMGHWREVLQARREVQRLRRVPDRQLIARFGYRISMTQTASPRVAGILEKVLAPIAFILSRFTRAIVRW